MTHRAVTLDGLSSLPGSVGPAHDRLQRYGPFALVLFLLGTSKWGSYLPTGHAPYIADLVLAVLLADRVLGAAAHRGYRAPRDTALSIAAAAMLTVSVCWFILGPWDLHALRDAAPYLYVVVVFLVLVPADSATRTMSRMIDVALVFHAVWCTVSLLSPGLIDAMPRLAGELPLFSNRGDFDGMVSGLLAGLALYRLLAGRAIVFNLVLLGSSVGLTLALGSRGGLLSLVTALVVGAALGRGRRDGGHDARRWPIALLLLVVPASVPFAAEGQAFERLSASVTNLWTPTEDVASAQGTAKARYETWLLLIDWVREDPVRELVGVGFGPNFLVDSKADVTLFGGGIDVVRSPHNYLVGTWARLGLIGFVIALALTLIGWRLAYRVVSRGLARLSDADVLAILLVVTVPLVAFVGVVLESPFGAIPYFWALGHLGALARTGGFTAPIRRTT